MKLEAKVLAIALLAVNLMPVYSAKAQESETGSSSVVELDKQCGNRPLSIASMQWPSSQILAMIHAQILGGELGCQVQVVPGEMVSTVSSMANVGEPGIAPEIWVSRIASTWNSLMETGRLRAEAATFLAGNLEGWYLPPHMAEQFPQIKSMADLKENIGQLTSGGDRVKFISCPSDWACSVINQNLLRAYDLQDRVELVVPKNRFEMDNLIGEVASRRQSAIFYYWQPNPILSQFDFLALEMGEYVEENFKCLAQINCPQPKPSNFAADKPFIVVADWVSIEAPLVARYLRAAMMPVEEMNLMLSWQAEGGLDFERLARRFVAEREEVWGVWVEGLN